MKEKSKGHPPLQKAMRVSVFNIILNFFLVLCKVVAGVTADSSVLLNDALHSSADTLCTALVLSGLGYEAKHPQAETKKVQGGIIAVLSVVIGATALGMLGGAVKILFGYRELPTDGFALAIAVLCVAVKAAMYGNTKRIARQSGNECLLADAFHHKSDCFSSFLVVSSVACSYRQWILPDTLTRFALGLCLLGSAYTLAKDAVALLRFKTTDHPPISQ